MSAGAHFWGAGSPCAHHHPPEWVKPTGKESAASDMA